jgi:hypothetical protein
MLTVDVCAELYVVLGSLIAPVGLLEFIGFEAM